MSENDNGYASIMMMIDGGPAFPVTTESGVEGLTTVYFGISVRDWFAGQAISGNRLNCATPKEMAEFAYMVADAMIAERNKKREG